MAQTHKRPPVATQPDTMRLLEKASTRPTPSRTTRRRRINKQRPFVWTSRPDGRDRSQACDRGQKGASLGLAVLPMSFQDPAAAHRLAPFAVLFVVHRRRARVLFKQPD